MNKIKLWVGKAWRLALRHKWISGAVAACFLIGLIFILLSYLYIGSYEKYVLKPGRLPLWSVGIVFGSGITKDGKPFRELQGRLDTAAKALNNGTVSQLLLSGDNRYKNYD